MARWPKTMLIEFMDGTTRAVRNVTNTELRNGVLHLSDESQSHYGIIESRGSFPIHNIRTYNWERE